MTKALTSSFGQSYKASAIVNYYSTSSVLLGDRSFLISVPGSFSGNFLSFHQVTV